jgi:hypothetical protein
MRMRKGPGYMANPQNAIGLRKAAVFGCGGLILPILVLGIAWPSHGFSLLLLAGYPVSTYRAYRYYMQAQELASQDAALYAVFCTLGKFPQVQGQMQFHLNRLLGRQRNLIEYKTATAIEPVSTK